MLGASVDIISRPPPPLSLLSQGCHHQNQMIGSSGHNTVTLTTSVGRRDFMEEEEEEECNKTGGELYPILCNWTEPRHPKVTQYLNISNLLEKSKRSFQFNKTV